ncbi:MAG TPA: Sir2 family NAD-dependent protein deacetylase [Acidimicrobiia bacterium]|nr:Sir2 family NAD-dependent protein deacetylase [Acidimicrobiia bacterium]
MADPDAVGLAEIAGWLRDARSVVVLTGAGISTESGIPDFRGPNGVWTKDPKAEKLSNLYHYMNDPEVRVAAWQARLVHPAWTAEPNAGHLALADLERGGHLDTLVTQNIDGLHQKAGSSPDRVIEIHGTVRQVVCMACAEQAPMERALDRVRAGEADPPCRSCGGILKSATISFGQNLVAEDLIRAEKAARGCDLFLALGTTLTVFPVAALPGMALEGGARLVIANAEPTPYDPQADAILRGNLGDVLPQLVALI